jgi:nitric oxide dioxygenase
MFYERLLAQHADLREYFHHVDINHQAVLFTMQLSVIEAFHVRRATVAELYLQQLGTKHKNRGIPKEVYPRFSEVLLDTLEQFHGTDWSDDLRHQWREAIDSSVNKMLEGYEDRLPI